MFNAARLTCFALISAIEIDSRIAVSDLQEAHGALLPKAVIDKANARRSGDRNSSIHSANSILEYLDFADTHEFLLSHKRILPESLRQSLLATSNQLGLFTQTRNRVAHNRPLEIEDMPRTVDISQGLTAAAPEHWQQTKRMLAQIADDPSSVLGLRIQLPSDPVNEPFHNLPTPDFDETGFLGRSTVLRTLKKYVLGSWPAISILGDGGIGKSALALKVAYDILDDPKSDFEAVVWVTAKSQQLTVHEIERISNAIEDSLGMFSEAIRQLGATGDEDPIAGLLEYMSVFKVLLVLDNLETVSDERLRNFLREIPNGSKVLMTSRIGVFKENDVKLDPLNDDESRALLMSLAKGRNVKVINDLDEAGRARLVKKLKGHPLYIKWVVSGVQAGRRPSDMTADSKLLLEFCMSNIYEQLGIHARRVLESMQVLRGVRYQGELAFINDMSASEIQLALLDLMRSNFISMTQVSGANTDAGYEVGEFAYEYLATRNPVSDKKREAVLKRSLDLTDLSSRLQRGSQQRDRRYDPRTVAIRELHNAPAARQLTRAMRETRAGKLDRALGCCAEAKQLSPGYYEAHRVEGYVHSLRRDNVAAKLSYEQAVELAEGDSKPLALFHLGAFLEGEGIELKAARAHYEEATRIDPDSCELFLRIGNAHFNEGSYPLSLGSAQVATKKDPNRSQWEGILELLLRVATFGGEHAFNRGQRAEALELLEECFDAVAELPTNVLNENFDDWFHHLGSLCERIAESEGSGNYLARVAQGLAVTSRTYISTPSITEARMTGLLEPLPTGKRYGFVKSGKESYFFHANDLYDRRQWVDLQTGNLMAFRPTYDSDRQKFRASEVRPLL